MDDWTEAGASINWGPDGYSDPPPEIAKELDAVFSQDSRVQGLIPSPEFLTRKMEKQKITILLNKETVKFFKRAATENGTKYQTLINGVLDVYAHEHRQGTNVGRDTLETA